MCELSQTTQALLSGLVGSIVGAAATVIATEKSIKASSREFQRQRTVDEENEYQRRLNSLKNEMEFNIALAGQNTNRKIQTFLTHGYENFIAHAHKIDANTLRKLHDAYGWAIFHNRAAELEDLGKENFKSHIQNSFDKAVSHFQSILKEI